MDKELEHICDELDIGGKNRQRLVDEGITTYEKLIQAKERLGREEVGEVKGSVQTELYDTTCWYQDFHEDHGKEADVLVEFSEKAFVEFRKERENDKALIEDYIENVLGSKYSDANKRLHHSLKNAGCYHDMIQECIQRTMTQLLKDQCGKFNYEAFAEEMFEHFHLLVSRKVDDEQRTIIVAGKTQSGKSSVKGVVQSMCAVLKIPLIVITKGVSESKDLHAKLKQLAQGTPVEPYVVCCSKTKGVGRNEKNREIQGAIQGGTHGGTLVVADTHNQIEKAIKALEEYRNGEEDRKFLVVVDECDSFYRTKDKSQKMEQAYERLMDMNPSLIVMISATPIPLILDIVAEEANSIRSRGLTMHNVEPIDDYVGLDQIQPLEIDGKKVYLEQNELSKRSEITFKLNSAEIHEEDQEHQHMISIPYANDKVKALYDNALSVPAQGKGILVLDCTCPRVYADCNVFEKAARVQEMYLQEGKRIVVITYTGKGVEVKLPEHEWENKKDYFISKLIEEIDDDERYGLGIPIFIFAFSKMRRGISYRSARRVPTHMLISLGRGHNAMNVVQTMGRATFNGKSVLKNNGFKHVTIMTTSNDFTMASKTQEYLEEVYRRHKSGGEFIDAVTGANEKMPDGANFLRHTFREIGLLKGQRKQFKDLVSFAEPPAELTADEEMTKGKYWEDHEAQRLLRTILQLSIQHEEIMIDDIHHAYEERFGNKMKKTKLTKWLRQFLDCGLMSKEKVVNEKFQQNPYAVNYKTRLRLFINDRLVITTEEQREGKELDEILRQCEDAQSALMEDSSLSSNSSTIEEAEILRYDTREVSLSCSIHYPFPFIC